jgi:hypothetical protein
LKAGNEEDEEGIGAREYTELLGHYFREAFRKLHNIGK